MPKQKVRRSRKHFTVYWLLLAIGVTASVFALQAVALWLPWRWAYEFAANATVWPIVQFALCALVLLVAAGFYYLYRRKMAIVFGVIGVVTLIPVIAMFVTHGMYAREHDVVLDPLEQIHITRTPSEPNNTIPYGQVGMNKLELSVYRNSDITKRSPAVVYVHGGGWSGGSRTENSEFFRWLNDRGYTVFSIDYRYATSDYASWRDAPRDVVCALSWLNTNADAQQIDRDNVAIMGDSAGGQLALRAAYGVTLHDVESSCGGEPLIPRKVAGIVPAIDFRELYSDPQRGPTSQANVTRYLGGTPDEQPEAYDESSIITHVKPNLQPTLIINAANDTLVSAGSGVRLADSLKAAGVRVEYYTIPYAVHSYWINPGGFQNQIGRAQIEHFLAQE